MHDYLIPMLECPACHGRLKWTIEKRNADQVEEAEARCMSCGALYSVNEVIGVFLTANLQRNDLWEERESGLRAYLHEHPEIEQRLLQAPLGEISPADQFIRAMILEERHDYQGARMAAGLAHTGFYTKEYRACFKSQIDYLTELVSYRSGPLIDLASGRCYLAEELAKRTNNSIIATDFSQRVLRRDQSLFAHLGMLEQLSFISLDARRMPFCDRSVHTMISNVGLANIENPQGLLQELRRVIDGEFISIMCFYPRDDNVNGREIEKLGLSDFVYQDSTLNLFSNAGFEIGLENIQTGIAKPTPKSELFEEASIDALPIVETELTWCTLIAH